MQFRLRFLIIPALACAPTLVAQNSVPAPVDQLGTRSVRSLPFPGGLKPGESITITADRLEATLAAGHRAYHATGDVQIDTRDLRLTADSMAYDATTGIATATGHVAFDSETEQTHIEGTHATYNFTSQSGEFDQFHGVSGVRLRGHGSAEVSNNPLLFSGSKLFRLGPDRYRIEQGRVTSCSLPNPKWELTARRVDFELGKDASLHHAVFRLFDVPIFYAPFLTHSTTRSGRHSGVLVPVASHSNIKGYILGDSYYWAAARNLNLTLGGELYTARGWADHLNLQSRPTRNSTFNVQLDGVLDRGTPGPGGSRLRQGGQELLVSGDHESASGFRTVLDVDYLSSYLYRLVFKNTFAEAINSEAVSTGFTERQTDGRDFAITAHRYQDFLGPSPHANLSLATLPALDWTAYAQSLVERLPLYFSWDASAGLLDRSEPGFATGAMGRTDFAPRLTLPLDTPAGVFTGDVAVRSTFYSEQQVPAAGSAAATAPPQLRLGNLWRNALDADVEWHPPALARVYNGPGGWLGHRLEHTFEPQLAFHSTSGVDNADEIIRFDARDILANTREAEYGFTNRLLTAGAQPGTSRELVSWTLLQKYYFDPTFGGAFQPGQRNVFLTTALLSPFSIEALPLRFSPLSSVIRVSPFSGFDGEWRLDYDSHDHRVAASAFSGNFHLGKGFFSGSHYMLHTPPGLLVPSIAPSFNQVRLATGYGNTTAPGFSLAGAVAYDAGSGRLQYTTIEASHNWDCCGFSLEYRRFNLATVRRENQFLISFNLANVGTFGNLKRQDRLF